MFSNEISMLDGDCISFCENSMYVLPPKTELNCSLFNENVEFSETYEKNVIRRDAAQRKISNNVYIPTYKGFSIANGYSKHNAKNDISNQKLNLNSVPEKYPISRKVHSSSKKPDSNNNTLYLTKNSINTKHKIKLKSDETKTDSKTRQHNQKNVKRVETFLGDYNPIKQNRSLSNTRVSKNNESHSKTDCKDDKKIKEYIEIKKRDLKKRENENKLIEKQRKEKIEERLKLLSEKVKHQEKIPKSHYKTRDVISIDVDDKSESCSSSHSKVYESSIEETISDSSASYVKRKLAKWTPMSNEELEIHRLTSKNYMTKAINNNQKADNILTDIINISDKIALAKQELLTSGKYSNKINHGTTFPTKNRVSVEINSTSSLSDEFENEESNSISSNDYPLPNKNNTKNGFKEVTPIILANRARRKLDLDIQENQDKCLDDESYCGASAYDDFVIRLIEENQRRYERSVEVHQTILLPHKIFPIPISNIKKNEITRRHEIIKTTKTDSLTFMRTYLKCKHKSRSDVPKSSTVNTNNSRISNETVHVNNLYSYNNHSSHDRDNNDIDNDFIKRKGSSTRNSIIYSNENTESETKRSSMMENANETIRDSNAFSEVEVTIENSSFTDQIINQHSTRKNFEKFTNYRNVENRLSPNSLERKLFAELHYYDGLQASMEQLLQSDRFQGVGFAQQETVSLAQVLKARQWKDSQDNETKQYLQQFTSAIDNFNDHIHHQHKKSNVRSSSSSYSSESMSSSSSFHKNVNSSTESEASDIVEEIVEFSNSVDSEHCSNFVKDNPPYHPISKTDMKNAKLKNEATHVIPKKRINKESLKLPYKTIEANIERSNTDSIKEISTVMDVSGSSSINSANLSQDNSIVESIDIRSMSEKSVADSNIRNLEIANGYNDLSSTESIKTASNLNQSKDLEVSKNHNEEISRTKSIKTDSSLTNNINISNNLEKSTGRSIETESYSYRKQDPEISKNYNNEVSTARSVKTDSNIFHSDKSLKEISSSGSFESETKSKINSSVSNKISNSKSTSKSFISTTENSIVKSDLNTTYYSKDEFESNSDYQKSTSESEVFSRVNFLENEKCRKEKLVDKLKRKLNIVKQRQKEKKLRDHISYLNSQLKDLEEELKNPNLSSSSLLLPSPSPKSQKHTNSKDLKILPTINRKSSNSSSTSSISKDEDAKSVTLSLSSSTLASEVIKDLSLSNKTDIKKIDEAETPRSSRQIQFEDINEEYSASNRDSSDLKTPSEKSYLSKEVTDNATNKSKSDNFHILVIDKEKDDFESLGNENDDVKVISARTIHSEISEIPMEGDLSDQEIDNDILDKVEEYEKTKSSIHDYYSEDFSEIFSQKNSITHPEINEISNHEEMFSYKTSDESTASSISIKSIKSSISSKSSESVPPVIPIRRKFLIQPVSDVSCSLAENTMITIDKICDELFKKVFAEIISENKLNNKNIPELIDSLLLPQQDDLYELDKSDNKSKETFENSLIEHIDDSQYRILENLISWNNENVLPLVDSAVEHIFLARQNRNGKTSDAFKHCSEHIPNQFLEINSSNEKIRIYNHWKVSQSLERSKIVVDKVFISRIAIFHAVLEIMEKIYELDDEPEPMPWMKDAFNILKNRKVVLWQGPEAPNSLELVNEIVKKQLVQSNILNSPQRTVINKSRQHKWFHKQTDDAVDKLLIDETLQDDLNWQNYDLAIETTIYAITDEINDIIFNDVENLHE